MMMEGRIAIDIFRSRGAVAIASTRPLAIAQRFSGLAPDDTVRTVSLLFSTCRAAQSIASASAFEDALGVAAHPRTKTARALMILAETAREHGLRILMDWPHFLRVPEQPDAQQLRALMQIDRDLCRALDAKGDAFRIGGFAEMRQNGVMDAIVRLKALLESAIFGEDLECWRARRTADELTTWSRSARTVAQRLLHEIVADGHAGAGAVALAALPHLNRDELAQRLFADDAKAFVAKPDWEGQPRETSPLVRQGEHPLVRAFKAEDRYGLGARLVASLVDLAAIPAQLADLLDAPAVAFKPSKSDGVGIAQVEAARGRLVHAVETAGGKVSRYRILAPTEWNFHPDGAAAHGLACLARRDEEECAFLARLFVTAVDPCVGADVRVH